MKKDKQPNQATEVGDPKAGKPTKGKVPDTKEGKKPKAKEEKKPAKTDVKDTKPEDEGIPKDLRHTKKGGRPSNADRTTATAMKDTIRKTCADILASFNKKDSIEKMSTDDKITYLQKMLPYVINEDVEDEGSVTMDLLCKKAMKVEMEISLVNQESLTEEDPDAE